MSSIQQHPHGVRMAESTLRRIQPLIFDENIADNFVNFEREWKVYQIAALSEKDKKVQAYTLLNLAGPDAILKSESFEYGNNESKEDPDVLIAKFREQCMPTKNIIIDRHNFNTCNQKQSEAFPSYLATIKILAKKCEFGTLNDELIRDRIVCGIYSDRVRKQLLREAALTLSSAVMICMASEQSDKNSKLLQKETNVHYVKTGGDKSNKHKQRDWHGSKTPTEHKNSDACYNCNTVHAHYRKSCPAYGKQCQNCRCYGHYATVCRKPKSAHKTHYKPNSSKAKHSYKVNELHENESESENYFHCDIIDDPSNKEAIHIDLTMMNTKAVLTVKIDTGAKINCISKNNLKRVNKDAKINSAVKINLIAYGGQQIETVGTTTLRTNKGDIMFHVVDRDVKTILGLTDTMKLNLIQLNAEVHSIVNPVIDDYSDLFDNTVLGKLPMDYHMRLDPTVPPVVCSARKIPVAMKQDVINELEHMKNIGVIEEVTEPTEWVSSMVAAKKKDGSIRLCIDPVHLNKALLRPHHPMKTIDDILGNMSNAKVFSILDAKTSFWQIPLDEQSSLLTTFITPNGRYKFLRMPYGITSGSEVFQRSRIQKMILKLQRYNISLVYKRGKDLLIADALSRAYQNDNESDSSNLDEYDIMHVEVLSNTRLEELKTATQNDHTSTVLKTVIMRGWPRSYNDVPKEAQPYYSFRDELTVVNDIILRGQRFVIPESLQSYYTTQLHKGHPGIDATKRRANECMYWNKMYTQLEEAVKKCAPCNALKPHQQKEPLLMHDVPTLPWTHVSSDIFEWHNKHYIVTTDSYSGWYEIDPLTDLRSTSVIHKLKRSFSTHGIPIELQTDNGTQYVSEQFREFTNDWDIKHVTSSPRYTQSNGLAERAVRSAKELLEKCYRDNSDIYLAILHARNVPKDGLPSAAQRLMSRRTRTTLPTTRDMLKPTVQTNVHKSLEKKRKQNKVHYDKSAKTLSMLQPGDTVRMQTDRGYDKIAIIERRTNDPRTYIVKCNGKQYRRNRKHLLLVTETAEQSDDDDIPYPRHDDPNDEQPINDNQCVQNNPTTYHTRSGRACLPNSRYQNDYV